MAIKLTADEAWTVYCALDDRLAARRQGLGSKHDYILTEDEHKKLQGRYLRAALVLERLEVKKREQFSEYGHYGENNPPIGVRNE